MTSSGIATTTVGDIELAYETFGDPGDTPLLLISGPGFADDQLRRRALAGLAARCLFVIRFDNRDVGLSTAPATRRHPRLRRRPSRATGRASTTSWPTWRPTPPG